MNEGSAQISYNPYTMAGKVYAPAAAETAAADSGKTRSRPSTFRAQNTLGRRRPTPKAMNMGPNYAREGRKGAALTIA